MDFNKLILGERELRDFENLLLRSKMIDAVKNDFRSSTNMREEYESALKQRINNKKKLLIFLMLFEKIDATNMSIYDYSRLIEAGIVDSESYLINGSDTMHLTSEIVDNAWKNKYKIISALYKITDAIFSVNGIDIYSKNLVHEEKLLNLCDSYLYGGKSDFFSEYSLLIPEVWKCYIQRIHSDASYGFSLIDDTDLFEKIDYSLSLNLDRIYEKLSKVEWNLEDIETYNQFIENLDAHVQTYSVPSICLRCESAWKKCCFNSEFALNTTFNCPQREYLGDQKYAKLNGLILSNTECATLFDNSLKFRCKKDHLEKVVEDIYYIVNVDLSKMVSSLPVPQNIDEVLRLRKREEIVSLRNIFLEWSHQLYCGNIDEAQYIKKSFDEAIAFMEKRRSNFNRKKSVLCCCFEALGNQIPYISNLLGAISPFLNRKSLLAEKRHKWILLTR